MPNVEHSFVLYALLLEPGGCLRAHITLFELVEPQKKNEKKRRHWACAPAEFIIFGRTEGIGGVPVRNVFLLAELKALGVCPCTIYCFWQN